MTEVRRLIARVLSLPDDIVYDANDEQDLSSVPAFITVNIAYAQDLGYERQYAGQVETINTVKNSTISVNAYGNNAYQLLEKLTASIKTSKAKSDIRKLGFQVLSSSQIRNLTGVISNAKEQRAQVDLIINHIHSISSRLDAGDDVTFTYKTE